jgi:protein-L-isoaspartate(D-aspartate) O-methyltransferase
MRALIPLAVAILTAQDFDSLRERMVREQIEARGVKDAAVLKSMRRVPRHLFVPPNLRTASYEDHPLPIGQGQTISQPYIVAVMSELLQVKPDHKVLEIGTGSGYQAAVLSPLAGKIFSIEIVPELAASAQSLLKTLGCANVVVRRGDGYKGWPEEAPFDRIILTAAPVEIPEALIGQMKAGGVLVAPVGPMFDQDLVVLRKDEKGRLQQRSVFAVRFVPMVPEKRD